MVRYRRNHLPGGTYFFTVTLADRRSTTQYRLLSQQLSSKKALPPFDPTRGMRRHSRLHFKDPQSPSGKSLWPASWR
jgi:hypothetical protein